MELNAVRDDEEHNDFQLFNILDDFHTVDNYVNENDTLDKTLSASSGSTGKASEILKENGCLSGRSCTDADEESQVSTRNVSETRKDNDGVSNESSKSIEDESNISAGSEQNENHGVSKGSVKDIEAESFKSTGSELERQKGNNDAKDDNDKSQSDDAHENGCNVNVCKRSEKKNENINSGETNMPVLYEKHSTDNSLDETSAPVLYKEVEDKQGDCLNETISIGSKNHDTCSLDETSAPVLYKEVEDKQGDCLNETISMGSKNHNDTCEKELNVTEAFKRNASDKSGKLIENTSNETSNIDDSNNHEERAIQSENNTKNSEKTCVNMNQRNIFDNFGKQWENEGNSPNKVFSSHRNKSDETTNVSGNINQNPDQVSACHTNNDLEMHETSNASDNVMSESTCSINIGANNTVDITLPLDGPISANNFEKNEFVVSNKDEGSVENIRSVVKLEMTNVDLFSDNMSRTDFTQEDQTQSEPKPVDDEYTDDEQFVEIKTEDISRIEDVPVDYEQNNYACKKRRGKKKRFSEYSLNVMEDAFLKNEHPPLMDLEAVANKIGESLFRVQNWFKNSRRQRGKTRISQASLPKKIRTKTVMVKHPKVEQNQSKDRQHLIIFNKAFQKNKYPSPEEYKALAIETGRSEDQVNKWFSNKRWKNRKKITTKHLFTTKQYSCLNKVFRKNKYPNYSEYQALARETGLSYLEVCNWFKHIRAVSWKKNVFSFEQTSRLNKAFQRNMYPSTAEYKALAAETRLSFQQVYSWFSKYRFKRIRRPSLKDSKVNSRFNSGSKSIELTKGKFNSRMKTRTPVFDSDQQIILQNYFKKNRSPNYDELKTLSWKVGLPVQRIRSWFQLKRNNSKRPATCRKNAKLYTREERDILNEFFLHTPEPSTEEIKNLADMFNSSYNRIRMWFSQKSSEVLQNTCGDNDLSDDDQDSSNDGMEDSNFSAEGEIVLNNIYKLNPHPSNAKIKSLSELLGESSIRIKQWFKMRNSKNTGDLQSKKHSDMHKTRKLANISKRSTAPYLNNSKMRGSKKPNITILKLGHINPKIRISLERIFKVNPNPCVKEMKRLSEKFNIPLRSVVKYFDCARKRIERMKKFRNQDSEEKEESSNSDLQDQTMCKNRQDIFSQANKTLLGNYVPKRPDKTSKKGYLNEKATDILIKFYEQNRFPSVEENDKLAEILKVPRMCIQTWFSRRRERFPSENDTDGKRPCQEMLNSRSTISQFPDIDDKVEMKSESAVSDSTESEGPSQSSESTIKQALEKYFAENTYPSHEQKIKLAKSLRVPVRCVISWFFHAQKRKGIHIKYNEIPKTTHSSEKSHPRYKSDNYFHKHQVQKDKIPKTTHSSEKSHPRYKSDNDFHKHQVQKDKNQQGMFSEAIMALLNKYVPERKGPSKRGYLNDVAKDILKKYSEQNPSPTMEERNKLASILKVPRKCVQTWLSRWSGSPTKPDTDKSTSCQEMLDSGSPNSQFPYVNTEAEMTSDSTVSERPCQSSENTTKMALEKYFAKNSFPNREEKQKLANSLGITERSVIAWFMHAQKKKKGQHGSPDKYEKAANSDADEAFQQHDKNKVPVSDGNCHILLSKCNQISKSKLRKLKVWKDMYEKPSERDINMFAVTLELTPNIVRQWFHQNENASSNKQPGDIKKGVIDLSDDHQSPDDGGLEPEFSDDGEDVAGTNQTEFNNSINSWLENLNTEPANNVEDNRSRAGRHSAHSFGPGPDKPSKTVEGSGIPAEKEVKLWEIFNMNANPSLHELEISSKLLDTDILTIVKWYERARQISNQQTSANPTMALSTSSSQQIPPGFQLPLYPQNNTSLHSNSSNYLQYSNMGSNISGPMHSNAGIPSIVRTVSSAMPGSSAGVPFHTNLNPQNLTLNQQQMHIFQPDIRIKQENDHQPNKSCNQSNMVVHQPNVSSPQPNMMSNQPVMTGLPAYMSPPQRKQPTVTSSQASITSNQPNITSNQPNITSNQPHITSNQPNITSNQPHITSNQPNITSNQQNMISQMNMTNYQSNMTSQQMTMANNPTVMNASQPGMNIPMQRMNMLPPQPNMNIYNPQNMAIRQNNPLMRPVHNMDNNVYNPLNMMHRMGNNNPIMNNSAMPYPFLSNNSGMPFPFLPNNNSNVLPGNLVAPINRPSEYQNPNISQDLQRNQVLHNRKNMMTSPSNRGNSENTAINIEQCFTITPDSTVNSRYGDPDDVMEIE